MKNQAGNSKNKKHPTSSVNSTKKNTFFGAGKGLFSEPEDKQPFFTKKPENPFFKPYTPPVLQTKSVTSSNNSSAQPLKQENKTGLSDELKEGVEELSGMDMDDVKVHYNSSKPKDMDALAYAQGADIHVAPGQEKHVAHEAWHVVQQKQGRVKEDSQIGDNPINTDPALEKEADQMGTKAENVAPTQRKKGDEANLKKVEQPIIQQQKIPIQFFDYGPKVAANHPITGKSIVFRKFIGDTGMYIYEESRNKYLYYQPDTKKFFGHDKKEIGLNPSSAFDEDTAKVTDFENREDSFRRLNFTVDSLDRPIKAKGWVTSNATTVETGRSGQAQQDSWKHVEGMYRSLFSPSKNRVVFHGGHIIAHHMGGAPGMNNMVPMESNYNSSGAYKQFENRIDNKLDTQSPLFIEVNVTYATDFADLMTSLVAKDDGNKVNEIDTHVNQNIKSLVYRVLGRIPKTITLTRLSSTRTGTNNQMVISPVSPMATLRGTIARNYKVKNLIKRQFKVSKTKGYDKKTKILEPFKKSYGPRKGEETPLDKDYHKDYLALYKDMPRPGITSYLPAINGGLAGGVEAYIWMDPMGIFNRFGGSDTSDAVDPLGTQWAYLRKAIRQSNNRGGIYKKGHLLNAHMHGPGADSRNLLPLTSHANSEMSKHFESKVQESEALTNPKKGIIWRVEAKGRVVRPLDWNRTAAGFLNSQNLFDEEARLPSYLDCWAWEAIQHKGGLERGRLLYYYKVYNKINAGDANGILVKTKSHGKNHANDHNQADDTGIDLRIPIGENDAKPHDTVNPGGSSEQYYNKGYALDFTFLSLVQNWSSYKSGLRDRAKDDGFAQKAKPTVSTLISTTDQNYFQKIINRSYYEGKDQRAFMEGYALHDKFSDPHPDRTTRNKFEEGSRKRGEDIGYKLGEKPKSDKFLDPSHRGWYKGLYKRGYDDGLDLIKPSSGERDYLLGFEKAVAKTAYEDGFHKRRPNWGSNDLYMRNYNTGSNERGYEDGYDLVEYDHGLGKAYSNGYNEGTFNRGYSDGLNAKRSISGDNVYMDGYGEGRRDLRADGDRDGYALLPPATNFFDYMEGHREGVQRRGYNDGRVLARIATDNNFLYNQSYNKGWADRAYSDGYNLNRAEAWGNDLYRENYNKGRYYRGIDDAKNDAVKNLGRNESAYNDGVQNGRGQISGYNLNFPGRFDSGEFTEGYTKGVADRGYNDGYNLKRMFQFHRDYPKIGLYNSNYWNGVHQRGYSDGLNTGDYAIWWKNETYMDGFNQGRRKRNQPVVFRF